MHEQRVGTDTRRGPGKQSLIEANAMPPLTAGKRTLTEQLPVIEKTGGVTPGTAHRHDKLALLGNGTAGHPGLAIRDLEAYINEQADWFTDPSLTAADRTAAWQVVRLFHHGPHVVKALEHLHTGELAALPDLTAITRYLAAFDPSAETVRLVNHARTVGDAQKLGQAIFDLEAFVPTPVLLHVIDEAALRYLAYASKVPELQRYYTKFQPTIERPEEWPHIQQLLNETITRWLPLVGWVQELHIFTPVTRAQLGINVADTSRRRPVLLIVMSSRDHNHAFLQGGNLTQAMLNPHNLALIVQGSQLADVTAQIARVAASHGQAGKLGQVMLAGHGSDTTMELGSSTGGATWDAVHGRVTYGGAVNLDSGHDPVANGTRALVDTIIRTLDPSTANLVFAGCLINSHVASPGLALSGDAAAMQVALRADLASHPNLADYVRDRITASGLTIPMTASNASTPFDTFGVDPAGRAGVVSTADPDIAKDKLDYVRNGLDAEGALRAAIECCARPAIGIARTTAAIRARVAGLARPTLWDQLVTRVGFELVLPAAGDLDLAHLIDLSHRIRRWVEYRTGDRVAPLANSVRADEADHAFRTLIAMAPADFKPALYLAWTRFDPAQAAHIAPALTGSALLCVHFATTVDRAILDPHLAAILPIGAPTRGQLVIALTIAHADPGAIPAPVRAFLAAAAGSAGAFPAALGVHALLPTGETEILDALIPLSHLSGPAGPVDANVDVDRDGTNDRRVLTDPHQVFVATTTVVHATPSSRARPLATLAPCAIVTSIGTTHAGRWTMIDQAGAMGFVLSHDLVP